MIAVLTGDVVSSQEMSAGERKDLHRKLSEAAEHAFSSKAFEVFGGDSWQSLCEPDNAAIAQALLYRSYTIGMFGIDTRISIGIGGFETLHREKISLSQGEAFVLSGKGLKAMPPDRRLGVHASPRFQKSTRELLNASCILLDCIVSSWTEKQAQAVSLAANYFPKYESPTQKELAERFTPPITPQAFGKHLASAQWSPVKEAIASTLEALRDAFDQAESSKEQASEETPNP